MNKEQDDIVTSMLVGMMLAALLGNYAVFVPVVIAVGCLIYNRCATADRTTEKP